ncbi:MAG: glycosyltransferase [Acidimicrobiia bacterium]
MLDVVLVTPVYRNAATLAELAGRVAAALDGRAWRLRFVVDACPEGSLDEARRLAAAEPGRLAVTDLAVNGGQHAALAEGLAAEADAAAWVCLDADLQDPPEAVPALLDRLAGGDVDAVFAGRRGRYESTARMMTGRLHRAVLARVTGLPPDAGAFVALAPLARDAIVRLRGPSVVAALGVARVRAVSVPVERAVRPSGRSAWTPAARLRQSARTLAWAVQARARTAQAGAADQRWTSTSA